MTNLTYFRFTDFILDYMSVEKQTKGVFCMAYPLLMLCLCMLTHGLQL
jgi:hypothetical protein